MNQMLMQGNRLLKAFHHTGGHKGPHDHLHTRHDEAVETKTSGRREIKVVRRVLDTNDIMANRNRALFAAKRVFVLNMMSSPGSGKTTTLQKKPGPVDARYPLCRYCR